LSATQANFIRHRRGRVALGSVALLCALPLAGCGNYDPETPAAAGSGQMTATGQLGTAGQNAMAGASGNTGQTASGGSGTSSVTPVEASCDAVEPCGGDVVGTWVSAGSCLPVSGMADMAGFGLGCTAAPVTGQLQVTGTWTAKADGTFTDETTTSGQSQIELPPECLTVSGTVTTCDRVGGALLALGYASVTCAAAASGSGCTCAATVKQTGGLAMVVFGPASSGMYTAAANVVTTSAGSATEYAYCVSENKMVMTPRTPGKTGQLTGTIAFVKP
jgi:hypothetical protein